MICELLVEQMPCRRRAAYRVHYAKLDANRLHTIATPMNTPACTEHYGDLARHGDIITAERLDGTPIHRGAI